LSQNKIEGNEMQFWVVEYGFDYECNHPTTVFFSKKEAEEWVADRINQCDDFRREWSEGRYKMLSFIIDDNDLTKIVPTSY
jgi:hypothetical protein